MTKITEMAYEAFEFEILKNTFLHASLGDWDSNELSPFNGFHANDAVVLHFPDNRHFSGIRANTFVVEIGWHEDFEGKEAFVVNANHKGLRIVHLYIERSDSDDQTH